MRICVFGAGAVGSFVAAHLVRAGTAQVSVVARGAQLKAISANGIRLVSPTEEFVARPFSATGDPASLEQQDIVFVTLKAMAQSGAAADIAALLKPGGHAVFAGNGIPWWWKHGLQPTGPLPLLDKHHALWEQLGPRRVLGCVVYSANELIEPGVVRNSGNNRWLLGEPEGGSSERLDRTVAVMCQAGLGAEISTDIRREFWAKLLRNVTSNPVCALTRLSIDQMAAVPAFMDMAARLIDEVVGIALVHGSDIAADAVLTRESLRYGGGTADKPFLGVRPSMLQDVLAARPLEVDAILGQVQLLARETNTPCPTLDLLVPLLRGLDQGIASRR